MTRVRISVVFYLGKLIPQNIRTPDIYDPSKAGKKIKHKTLETKFKC